MTKTYRDIFKWGDPSIEEPLDVELLRILKERINFTPRRLSELPGSEKISVTIHEELDQSVHDEFSTIVGDNNISTDPVDLIDHATGASYTDVLKIRKQQIEDYPAAVIYPRSEEDIVQILEVCKEHQICVIPTGGRSSVTEGIKYPRLGIALDLTRHLNQVIKINEIDNTVTVDPGIMGPDLEQELNQYQSNSFPNGFTCGHFPQSFEYSTVGGWVVTRGAGQESTGYGKIEDMVLGLRMVTPEGIISVPVYPAKATGPDLLDVIVGSEGAFGIVTEITLKIRPMPKATKYAAFLFKTWEDGVNGVREVMQGRHGKPFIFRLSDPEESEIYLEMANVASWKEWILKKLGYQKGNRVLLLCSTAGTKKYASTVMKEIKSTISTHNGRYIGSSAVHEWLKDRYHTPYLRATLMDHDLVIDTLETATTWDNLQSIWKNVRSTIKSRPNTIAMVHLSHMYENGSNLYFIFISKASKDNQLENYTQFQNKIIDSIVESGGSLSHHHGIGRLFSSRLQDQLGAINMNLLQSIKKVLDPDNLMNPGVLNLN